MSLSNYTINVPEDAIIVDNWDAFHTEAKKFPWSMVEQKYGGNVIEVDGIIKLATTAELSKQIEAKMASLPADTEEEIAEAGLRDKHVLEHHMPAEEREKWKKEHPKEWAELQKLGEASEEIEESDLEKRACSHPRCFFDSTCRTYNDCHVCNGATPPGPHGAPANSGKCI